MMMKLNLGKWDRWLRIALGAFVVSLAFWGPRTPLAWLGLLPLVTGLFGHCPAYTMLGISTCPLQKKPLATDRRI